jgi:hypothetical protein
LTYPKGYHDPKEEARYKKLERNAWIVVGIILGLLIFAMIVFPENPTLKEILGHINKILSAYYGI